MNVSIWDIDKKEWICLKNIKDIHQSCQLLHYFEIDAKKYDTENYTLVFIHNN